MEPSKSAIAPANTSIPVTSTTEKKDDREILAEAIASVVNRINESFSRLTKVEKQLNLHPRNVQDYPDSVKQFDILFPSLATLLNVAKQTKLKLVLYQVCTAHSLTHSPLLLILSLVYTRSTSSSFLCSRRSSHSQWHHCMCCWFVMPNTSLMLPCPVDDSPCSFLFLTYCSRSSSSPTP